MNWIENCLCKFWAKLSAEKTKVSMIFFQTFDWVVELNKKQNPAQVAWNFIGRNNIIQYSHTPSYPAMKGTWSMETR